MTGAFRAQQVQGSECTSAVGFCTRGQIEGPLRGDYWFVMDTMTPSPTPEQPLRFTFTARSTITTEHGRIWGTDHGTLWVDPDTNVMFVTGVSFINGDGCWSGVSGMLTASGQFDVTTGTGIGNYEATVCDHRRDVRHCLAD